MLYSFYLSTVGYRVYSGVFRSTQGYSSAKKWHRSISHNRFFQDKASYGILYGVFIWKTIVPEGIILLVTGCNVQEESMSEGQRYDDVVRTIKTAILQSQYDAAKSVNEKQLILYYEIGKYISMNSRKGF